MASDQSLYLPPGYRFFPTDAEVIEQLEKKVINPVGFFSISIGEVDLNKNEPWDLPRKAKTGEKEWYFFCQKDKKYPTGMRTNRATQAGYWKATGKDKEIFYKLHGRTKILAGMKKTLVFYKGRAPKGEKTNWVMHEFRLEGNSHSNLPREAKDSWVVCKVFHKNIGGSTVKRSPVHELIMGSYEVGEPSTLPPLIDPNEYIIYNDQASHAVDHSFRGGTGTSSSAPIHHQQYSNFSETMMVSDINQQAGYYNNSLLNQPAIASSSIGRHQYLQQPDYFGLGNLGYLQQDDQVMPAIRRHCKAEQQSHNSTISVSHDTVLSNDKTMEISSIASIQTDDFDEFLNNMQQE